MAFVFWQLNIKNLTIYTEEKNERGVLLVDVDGKCMQMRQTLESINARRERRNVFLETHVLWDIMRTCVEKHTRPWLPVRNLLIERWPSTILLPILLPSRLRQEGPSSPTPSLTSPPVHFGCSHLLTRISPRATHNNATKNASLNKSKWRENTRSLNAVQCSARFVAPCTVGESRRDYQSCLRAPRCIPTAHSHRQATWVAAVRERGGRVRGRVTPSFPKSIPVLLARGGHRSPFRNKAAHISKGRKETQALENGNKNTNTPGIWFFTSMRTQQIASMCE
jgi:hypothetical protein